jgi:hypothetical protein
MDLVEPEVAEPTGHEPGAGRHNQLVGGPGELACGPIVELQPAGRETGDLRIVPSTRSEEGTDPVREPPAGRARGLTGPP